MVKFTSFINNNTLKMKVKDLLNKFDENKDGFNKEEFNKLAKNSVSIFAKPLVNSALSNKAMKKLDLDLDENISYEEMKEVIESYDIKYEDALDMSVEDLVNQINIVSDERKKNKNKQI